MKNEGISFCSHGTTGERKISGEYHDMLLEGLCFGRNNDLCAPVCLCPGRTDVGCGVKPCMNTDLINLPTLNAQIHAAIW